MKAIAILYLLLLFTEIFSFSWIRPVSLQNNNLLKLLAKRKPHPGNIPRKIKRTMRSCNSSNFDLVLTETNDNFLKTKAKGQIYQTLMHSLTKRARHLNITLPEGFGVKPKIPLLPLAETIKQHENSTVFRDALLKSNIMDLFSSSNNATSEIAATNYTVLIPVDSTFDDKAVAEWQDMTHNEASKNVLNSVVKKHVVPGVTKLKKLLTTWGTAPPVCLSGDKLKTEVNKKKELLLSGAKLMKNMTSIRCSNGIIHFINKPMTLK